MRVGELSDRSGVAIATIKYYLREGLLPSGDRAAHNQADYDDRHLERLLLIRALREGGGLSIQTLRAVVQSMDRYTSGRPEYLAIAIRGLSEHTPVAPEDREAYDWAVALVDELLAYLEWDVDPDSPGRADLVRAVLTIERYLPGTVTSPRELLPYALAMRAVAEREIQDEYDPEGDPQGTLRYSVLGTVLFEPLILALRRLAHVDRQREIRETLVED